MNLVLRIRPLLLVATLCAALSACQGHDGAAGSQVAARVNGIEVSVHQVQAMLQRNPQLAHQLGPNATAEALRQLIEQELAAQAAAKDGLVNEPRLIQLQALQQRELFARAYLDAVADKTSTPDYVVLNAYIDAHRAGFADHRQFILENVLVLEPPDRIEALKSQLNGVQGWERIWSVLQKADVRVQSQTSVVSTTQLDDVTIAHLSDMHEGDFTIQAQPSGGALLQVMRKNESLPLDKRDQHRIAEERIVAERRAKAIEVAMDALKASAKIEYVGEGESARALVEGKPPVSAPAATAAPSAAKPASAANSR